MENCNCKRELGVADDDILFLHLSWCRYSSTYKENVYWSERFMYVVFIVLLIVWAYILLG